MVVFKDSAREFVLLALSNALLSSLHSSSFSSLTSSSLSSRERRASSLDFVAHTGARNRTALESLFFLFVLSLCVLKTRKSTRTRITTETRTRTKRRSICVADEEDGKEESVMTPTTRENNGEEGGEGDENTSSFYGEVLSSDDDDDDDSEEEEELDEELEDVHRKWEIVARYPCVLHRVERTKNDANDNDKTSSLLDAWMRAVPRKGKRKLKAVGFGRDTGNGFFKDLTECNFRVEVFRCIDERCAKREEEGERSDGSFEKRRRVEIDEEDNDD